MPLCPAGTVLPAGPQIWFCQLAHRFAFDGRALHSQGDRVEAHPANLAVLSCLAVGWLGSNILQDCVRMTHGNMCGERAGLPTLLLSEQDHWQQYNVIRFGPIEALQAIMVTDTDIVPKQDPNSTTRPANIADTDCM